MSLETLPALLKIPLKKNGGCENKIKPFKTVSKLPLILEKAEKCLSEEKPPIEFSDKQGHRTPYKTGEKEIQDFDDDYGGD